MQLLISKSDFRPLRAEPQEASLRGKFLSCFLPCVAAFLLCLLNNFVFPSARIMLSTDGKHYLTTLQQLCQLMPGLLQGHPDPVLWGISGFGGHLLIDGPILVSFYGLPFSLLSHMIGPRDWPLMALGQSVFHALSTLLVALLALRCTKSALFSFLAACLWALYPNAILQTGHFMTETPVSFLLLLTVFLISSRKQQILYPILAGVSAALIGMGKPALWPAVALILFYGAMQFPRKPLTLFLVCAGAFLALAPWIVYFHATTGKASFTAQRLPTYNVAKGWNPEADGWGYTPHPPLTELYSDDDGPLNTAYGLIASHPQESVRLMWRKTSRLFSLPWNDFKNRVLGLDMSVQILIHRLLLCAGFFGTAIFVGYGYKKLDPAWRLPLEASILLCLGHFSYLMVESTARYSFTAMPFVVLLAAYGFWQAGNMSLPEKTRNIVLLLAACLSVTLTALVAHAEELTWRNDARMCKEIVHNLGYGQSVAKTFDLSCALVPAKIQTAFVLIDGDKEIEHSDVYVNGHKLAARPLSAMHFDAMRYCIFDQMREFAPAMGINAQDLRQWRMLSVPVELLNLRGRNTITLTCKGKSAVVYADENPSQRYMHSPNYCNYGLLASSALTSGAESRLTDPVSTASVKQSSFFFSNDLTSSRQHLPGSLKIRLALVLPALDQANQASGSSLPDVVPALYKVNVERKSFDPMLWDVDSTERVRMNKTILYAARSNAASIKLPDLGRYSHWKIKISGELRSVKNPGDVGLLSVVLGKNGEQVILGKTPRALQANFDWRKFVIEDIVPNKLFASAPGSICLALYPVPWMEGQYGASRKSCDSLFRNLKIEFGGSSMPELASNKIIYY